MDCSLPGSSVHGILQAGILEWVVVPSSRDLPNPEIKQGFLAFRWILYCLSYQGSPGVLEWIAYPFSRGLPNPGIEPGSPALLVDSLPTKLPGKPVWLLNSAFNHDALWHWCAQRPLSRCVKSQETGRGSTNWTWRSHSSGAVTKYSPRIWRIWERRTLRLLESFLSAGELRKLEAMEGCWVEMLRASSQLNLFWSIPLFPQPPQITTPCVRWAGQGTH